MTTALQARFGKGVVALKRGHWDPPMGLSMNSFNTFHKVPVFFFLGGMGLPIQPAKKLRGDGSSSANCKRL